MKNLAPIVKNALKIFLVLSIIGLIIDFLFILWNLFSHIFQWEGFVLKYYDHIDFNKIWANDKTAFNIILIAILVLNILQINLFLKTLKLLKQLDTNLPFNYDIGKILKKITIFAFAIGILSIILKTYIELSVRNNLILSTQVGHVNYLWLAAIFYIMTLVYEKGLFLQSENDLTI